MNNKSIRLVQLSTTAWEEEDILIVTNLTDKQIESAVSKIIADERERDIEYDNEALIDAIKRKFPKHTVIPFLTNEVDYLNL